MLSIKYSEIRQNCRNSFITVPWFFTVLHSETCCPSGFTVCRNMFRLDLYCTIPWRIIKPPTLSQKLSESPYKNRTYEGWSRCNGICLGYEPEIHFKKISRKCEYNVTSGPAVIGSVFMRRFRLFLGQ